MENIEPELRLLSENPELKREHDLWSASRAKFNTDLKDPGSDAQVDKWQKLYYRGLDPGASKPPAEGHRRRLRPKPFKRPGEDLSDRPKRRRHKG
jgi:hypothetical protein